MSGSARMNEFTGPGVNAMPKTSKMPFLNAVQQSGKLDTHLDHQKDSLWIETVYGLSLWIEKITEPSTYNLLKKTILSFVSRLSPFFVKKREKNGEKKTEVALAHGLTLLSFLVPEPVAAPWEAASITACECLHG